MGFLTTLLKILIMLGFLLFMALPFLMEWGTFRSDKERRISFKRFRQVVFTLVYTIGITLALYLLKEFVLWLESLSLIQWIAGKLAVSSRVQYCAKVFVAMLVNGAVGLLYVFLSKLVRIGLAKKELVEPKQEDGQYTPLQRVERAVIKFFHKEIWFFVGRLFKWLFIGLSALYALIFVLYQLPALFGASWLPYNFISCLFSAGYVYPCITLLMLCQISFFLQGVERLEEECPELLEDPEARIEIPQADLKAIDEEVKKQFGDHYVCDLDMSKSLSDQLSSGKHSDMTKYIAAAVEADHRNTQKNKEVYLSCLDKIVESDKSIVINGSFCSEFSMYLLRYLSIVLARGDNVAFVCNSDGQIDTTYDYIVQALSEMSSLYYEGHENDTDSFDHPIWKVVKVHGHGKDISHAEINNASILVTSLEYLCSSGFEQAHKSFIHLLDTVVFVDALTTVNTCSRRLSMLNTRLKQIFEANAMKSKNGTENKGYRVRYMARQVRYICFDASGTSGLDKVLKNLLSVEFESADCMYFSPGSIVRCYNYECRSDETGRQSRLRLVDTDEEIGAIMNMAILCLAKGASNVTILASQKVPYENYLETIDAHKGSISVLADENCIRVNKYHYNPDGYCVIIAMDSDDNLPVTVRKCVSLASGKPALVMIFSRQHIMREYYAENIADLWGSLAFQRIPVESGNGKDAARRIAVMANSGGISMEDILQTVSNIPCFEEEFRARDVDGILRKVLALYGIPMETAIDLYTHFEYKTTRDFDSSGHFCSVCKVFLRESGELYNRVNGSDVARLRIGDVHYPLPVPVKRITQKYIQGQNLLYDGNVYRIYRIDTDEGVVYAEHTTSGKNDGAYEYIQSREYRVEASPDKLEPLMPTKHIILGKESGEYQLEDIYISVVKAPAEVLTRGYFEVDPRTMSWEGAYKYHSIADEGDDILARQTYRRYGDFSTPTYSTEDIVRKTQLVSGSDGILMMDVKFRGALGKDPVKTANLAAAMLDELLKQRFPSVADAIAVCPVIRQRPEDKDFVAVSRRHPILSIAGDSELLRGEGFEFVIIEDSAGDLGVISGIMSAGDDILQTLFTPVYAYLQWYEQATEKSKYLYCGLDHEPTCFDFEALHKVSQILGDDKQDVRFVDIDTVTEYHVCSFCGKKYPKSEQVSKLEDGRLICDECAKNLVGNNKKELKAHLDRARRFLESTYGIVLDDSYEVCFESTAKVISALRKNKDIVRRGGDVPTKAYVDDKRRVHVEHSIPAANLAELLVRELTYAWQLKHVPNAPEDIAQGHIALVGIQYLRFLGHKPLADVRTRYYESNYELSGKGYRKLAAELVKNPQYKNNPFKYILQLSGETESEEAAITPVRPVIEDGDFGKAYTPEQPDRALDGNIRYFYYSNLTATCQNAYDVLLAAISRHAEMATVEGCSFAELEKVSYCIAYDHPELFWYKTLAVAGNQVKLFYGATAEEAAVLQRRIDEVVPKYLEGIDDSMSAYDVAIRLHAKIISAVDYDTIALNREEQAGGPDRQKIDYLRTICGVFLEGKAVCEGYARAMQYLLQRCGIECAEMAGHIHNEKGENQGGHAWNLLRVDGDYYYLDTTWDDSSDTIQNVKQTDLGFDYFCITTEELFRTRSTDLCPTDVPACTAVRANYFHHNDFVIDSYDLAKIKTIAQTAARNKCKSFTFKCKTRSVYETAVDKLCAQGQDCGEVLKAAAKENKQIQTGSFAYTYDKNIWTVTVKFKFK